MIRLAFILLPLLSYANVQGQKATTPQDAVQRFYKAMATANRDSLRTTITSNFLMLEDGTTWTIDSVVKAMAPVKGTDFQIKSHFHFLHVYQRSTHATVAFWHDADVYVKGKWQNVRYLESAELVKKQGNWKLSLLHTTHVKAFKTAESRLNIADQQ
jgi:hypothetical protein